MGVLSRSLSTPLITHYGINYRHRIPIARAIRVLDLSAQLIVRLIAPTVYGLGCAWNSMGLLSLRGAVIWRRVTAFVGAVLGAVGNRTYRMECYRDFLPARCGLS